MEQEYKYKNVDLIQSVFDELLVQLFEGKQFKRADAIKAVTEYHKSHGGILQLSQYVATFKKSCQHLRDKISNPAYGVWYINTGGNNNEDKAIEYYKPAISSKTEDQSALKIDKTIGIGVNSVYVYFYPSYKILAEKTNKKYWPCKVGRTDVDLLQRITGQSGTCFPEYPQIALLINCDDSRLLEKTFHDILKLKKRHITDSPGKEWFFTNPTEIEEIYNTFNIEA